MSTSRDPDSSLELLLDTMCNTFGGIIFIAISLVIFLSAMKAVQDNRKGTVEEEMKLLKEITALEKLLEENRDSLREQQILEAMLRNDPRSKLQKELILLESKIKKMTAQKTILDAKKVLLSAKKDKSETELKKLQKELKEIESKLQKIENEYTSLKKKKERQIGNPAIESIQLDTLETAAAKAPYYFLVEGNCLWRIGPDEKTQLPVNDVTYTVGKDQSWICKPDMSKGIMLLSGDELSPEFQNILQKMDEKRYPHFSIRKNAAKNFKRARELLKQQGIKHGFDLEFEQRSGTYVVYLVKGATYEY